MRRCWRETINQDEPACFTNYLSTPLLAAPGAVIDVGFYDMNMPYCCSTGISATILGAGTALLKEAFPNASNEQILKALRETGVNIKQFDHLIGYRVSLHRAYLQLKEQVAPPNPQPGPTPGPTPAPTQKAAKDFDKNGDCVIDDHEYFDAVEEWIAKQIDDKLFFEIADVWITQTNICTAG
ncbi:MAG: hypothetical protein A2Z21_04345 [Candidatus Fraserbacteria bacterium RBG_16_55_9]|uniref:Peptidase S8/S53 domain-containing protein n=1 Tax=Fraserbacteria sp. (strain RBG_16_55_9) TaxID=1817864 RepID=A0A1F5UP45_FRAXR|nr:MAG: hypothetical protein A2Z21_04345 [Candidatus Fraserbacteria bacterium RBG_16_55_9]